MEITLSILIATMPSRTQKYNSLMSSLMAQGNFPNVEVVSDESLDYNIGTKRNKLLTQAKGEYICFCDDDDRISPAYVESILKATEAKPDCIGISGLISFDGRNIRQWHISKDYGHWYEAGGVYYRTPNHISPVRRELALQTGFPEIQFGEDHDYSVRLLPLLKTEVKIPGNLYFYDYNSIK